MCSHGEKWMCSCGENGFDVCAVKRGVFGGNRCFSRGRIRLSVFFCEDFVEKIIIVSNFIKY